MPGDIAAVLERRLATTEPVIREGSYRAGRPLQSEAELVVPRMELRHLRYFLAVANARSFTRAAERLHVTQPTLSHQIKQLEAVIGTELLERTGRDVGLTAAGQLFKAYCERIVREVESSLLAVSELKGLMRGSLRMGVFHSFSNSMLPPILAEFALRYPGVHVTARLVPRQEMDRDLLSGELDVAVAYPSDECDQIEFEPLFNETLVLVVRADHPLAAKMSLPIREIAALPLVLLTREFGARQFVDRFFGHGGQQPHIVLEMNAIEPILSTVRNSGLASVLSAGTVVDRRGLRVVQLTHPVPSRPVGILWRRNGHRSPAAQRMADMIRAAYQDARSLRAVVACERRPRRASERTDKRTIDASTS